ncbi:MAG: DUF4215 domain-containing protein [Byssovorax sp.]
MSAALAGCGDQQGQTPTSSSTTSGTGGGTTTGTGGSGGGSDVVCGDGKIGDGETCDDGNTAKGDGCDDACKPEKGFTCKGSPSVCKTTCGDGEKVGDEACDDGNIVGGDGCSPKCAVEDGFTCDGDPSACTPICGDGKVVGDEGCDDGNPDKGDGCSDMCTPEDGYTCDGEPSICTATCGDGQVVGDEACDDGNTKNKDGCSASCTEEIGYKCDGEPSVCATVCGDGVVIGDEACDDGNTDAGDGCDGACAVEPNYTCAGAPSVCTPVCGDGVILAPETCDDGNGAGGDGCDATCKVQMGYACEGAPSQCHPVCGDGLVIAPETCDDGNIMGGDGCTATCVVQMGFFCAGSPSVCLPICGDGMKLGNEGCDDGNTKSGDGCDATCAVEPGFGCMGNPSVCSTVCGDGVKAGNEGCDDGNQNNSDCCNNLCQLLCEVEPNDTPVQALASGVFTVDLVVKAAINPGTDVDYFPIKLLTKTDLLIQTFDGTGPNNCNNVDTVLDFIGTDGTTVIASNDDVNGANSCSRIDPATTPDMRGLDPGTYYAKVTPFSAGNTIPAYTIRFTFVASCGNNVVEGSEECDGNGGPPCDATCQRIPVCGDGFTDAPETCDDANMVNGDGCNSCVINPGYQCVGAPSVCLPICGDGMQLGAEQCDDGNRAIGDGCDAACKTETSFAEVEPNDTVAQANAQPANLSGASNVATGAIGAVGDKDLFKITVGAASVLRLETFGPSGDDCPMNIATTLRLLNSAGIELYVDAIKGINFCSALEVNVAPGTYYASVEEAGNNATIPAYKLQVKVQTSKGSEVEPNPSVKAATTFAGTDVFIAGSHQVAADVDFYAIIVPPGRSVRAEVIEGAAETCESQGIDSYLELYDSDGILIATDDDGGRAYCSAIDGTGATPFYPTAHALPADTYYLAVRASPFAAGADAQFDYKLALTVR